MIFKHVVRLIKKISKHLTIFDYVTAGVVILFIVVTAFFLLRTNKSLLVRVRITDRDMIYMYNNPPAWFANDFKKAAKTKDVFGRVTAEITDVYSYESITDYDQRPSVAKDTVYITLRLKTNYNRIAGEYRYMGMPVAIGESLRIYINSILINGLVTDIEGFPKNYETVYPIIKTRIKQSYNSSWPNTTGVDQYVADALNIGDKVFDSFGDVIAEITEKKVVPAEYITTDYYGVPHLMEHPRRVDIYLTVKVKAKKIDDNLYFLDDFVLRVESIIPLNFNKISLGATITDVVNPDAQK